VAAAAGTSIAQVRAVGASKNLGVWDWPRGGVGLVVVVRSTADVASCASSQNTRFYDLVPREVGGTQVTPHSRIERFDGSTVNNRTGLSVASASDEATLRLPGRSTTSGPHSARTSFIGTDAKRNSLTSPAPIATLTKV